MRPAVTVYTNEGCAASMKVVEHLRAKGVPFTEKNVARDEQARRELEPHGVTALPIVLIGQTRLTGFNPDHIDAALASAA